MNWTSTIRGWAILSTLLALGCTRLAIEIQPLPTPAPAVKILSPTLTRQANALLPDRCAWDSTLWEWMGTGEPGAYELWLADRRLQEGEIRQRISPLYLMRDFDSYHVRGFRWVDPEHIRADVVIDGDTTALQWRWYMPALSDECEWLLPGWTPQAILTVRGIK